MLDLLIELFDSSLDKIKSVFFLITLLLDGICIGIGIFLALARLFDLFLAIGDLGIQRFDTLAEMLDRCFRRMYLLLKDIYLTLEFKSCRSCTA